MWLLFIFLLVGSTLSCSPGISWKEDCNLCVCDDEGQARCTLRFCLHGKGSITDVQAARVRSKCTPGIEWFDGCNTCYCLKNQEPVCTSVDCSNERPISAITLKRNFDICDHGSFWLHEGLLCQCIFGNPSCKRFVSAQSQPKADGATKCSPNSTVEQNGYSCVCWSSGMGMDCKSIGPPVPLVPPIKDEGCVAGKNCKPPSSVAAKAKYVQQAHAAQSSIQQTCVPGKITLAKDGCHYCSCKSWGKPGHCIDFCSNDELF